jgi:hypothetical protein
MDLGIDLSLLFYILVAFLIGFGGPYFFMNLGKTYTAGGFALAAIGIFTYFGLRWFDGLRLKQSMMAGLPKTTSWPPQINACPDFLSLKKTGTGTTAKYYCVDTMGLTGLTLFTSTSAIDLRDSNNYLELSSTGTASTYATSFLGGRTQGMTWEGIYDGITASGAKPPYPSS